MNLTNARGETIRPYMLTDEQANLVSQACEHLSYCYKQNLNTQDANMLKAMAVLFFNKE